MAHIVTSFNQALRRQARGEVTPAGSSRERAQPDAADEAGSAQPQQRPVARRSAEHIGASDEPSPKRLKSPSNSVNAGDDPGLSTAAQVDDSTSEFTRPPPRSKGRLWTEGDPTLPRSATAAAPAAAASHPSPQQRPQRGSTRRHHGARAGGTADEKEDPSVSQMISQPETRPISQEQLVAEVKGIYAGLVMVESKCIEVDSAQSAQSDGAARLNNEQWQALIALHRTLLHEHHDFFLASQHPSASTALQRLAHKYAMPARMWRHGIHSFLELLRHRLPASLEHMLTFIYLAYSMMALLFETVPAFEDTWIECLGDLGRYRMAIEDEDIRDREIWTGVSKHWYSMASDKAPTTGRLHHHLAILARPNAISQLFYYTKSLCVAIPFKSARDSILTLFEPILNGNKNRLQSIDFDFVKTHGILFIVSNTNDKEKSLPQPVDEMMQEYSKSKTDFISQLDNYIARTTRGWIEPGGLVAIANNNAILEYGKTDSNAQGSENVIMAVISPKTESDVHMEGSEDNLKPVPSKLFGVILDFVRDCDSIIFKRYGDNNVLTYLHVRLAFMLHMAPIEPAMKHLEHSFSWTQISLFLNSLTIGLEDFDRIEAEDFPQPTKRPLPEDWNLRGLLWTQELYPSDWFGGDKVDEDEKAFELPSMMEYRRERVLWLGHRLASFKKWIIYDGQAKRFQATPEFHQEADASDDATLAERMSAISRTSTVDSTATMVDEPAD